MSQRRGPACDGCRLRKVKCYGNWPCTQCAHLNLPCNISAPASRRRPQIRGKLVARLRGQEPVNTSSPQLSVINTHLTARSKDFFFEMIPQFSEFVYPLNPVVSPEEIEQAILNMEQDAEDAALVHAFAAITINRTRSSWSVHGELAVLMVDLVHCSLKAYRHAESESDDVATGRLGALPVTVKRILTTLFLSVCMLTLGRADRSFAILREGVTMLQALDLNEEFNGLSDKARWQRLYWVAYVHERHMALSTSFRGSLSPPKSGLPAADTGIPAHIDLGFRRLLHLFLILDDNFVAHWRAQQNPEHDAPELTAEWIALKQAQLDKDVADAELEESELRIGGQSGWTELQRMDVAITRLWLRTLIWQMALSGSLLSSAPPEITHQGLSLHFPVTSICMDLSALFNRLESVTSVGFQGIGMLQKLFEITSTIAEVLTLPIKLGDDYQDHASKVADLSFVIEFLQGFEAIPRQQRDYLTGKLKALKDDVTLQILAS